MTNDEIVEQVRLDRESCRVPLKALTAANVPPASSATSSTDVPLTSALASTVAAPFVFSEGCVFWLGSKGDVPAAATAASITEDVSGSSNGGLSTAQKNFNIHKGQGMTKACLSKRPPTNYAMTGASRLQIGMLARQGRLWVFLSVLGWESQRRFSVRGERGSVRWAKKAAI